MQTDIYEADPFSAERGAHLGSVNSDYRFETGDEFFIQTVRGRMKVRVLQVVVRLEDGHLTRDLLVLKL